MYKRILVPIDCSNRASLALGEAIELPGIEAAEFASSTW
jgi:nucleotide-binding universal stress UspA family protein